MKKIYLLIFLVLVSVVAWTQSVSITALGTPVTENFNSLANTGTSSTTPSGWYFAETGSSANSTYTAGTGSINTGDTYSFGSTSATDRAFGGLQSGALNPTIGASFTNSTGQTITRLVIKYTGEQWRLGALARVDRLDFQYSLNATSLTTGTWKDADALDFTAPVTAGTVGALDGNNSANRTVISAVITGLSIANGSTFWIRWNSFDATSNDDGLDIDDFSLAATILIDGTITGSEYGTHTNGNNQQSSATGTWYMSWDETNLYVAITGANTAEGAVLYLDKDPIVPVNGGSNTDGSLVGNNYDGSNFANLQFRADLVVYFKDSYREYRTANGTGGWSAQTSNSGFYASASGTREVSIPWSAIGGRPASFNWFGHVAYTGGGAYASVPTENPGSGGGLIIGSTARWDRYYTVSNTAIATPTPPFSRNSYTFTSASDVSSFGAITCFDFTMNSAGRFISRTGATSGNWAIANNMVIGDGIVYFGSGGGSYGTSTVGGNLDVRGGTLHMDATTGSLDITGNVNLSSGTLRLSDASGGDLKVRGNWNYSGGTFTPNSRAVFFDGTSGDQTVTGTTTFDFLLLDKSAGNLLLASPISLNQTLTLTNGKVVLGANDLSLLNTAPSSLSAGSATSYVVTDGAGAFKRAIGSLFVAQDYFFPVGTAANRQRATINFNTISANNTLAARFLTGSTGNFGLNPPLTENGDEISRVAFNGRWEINAASATSDLYTGTFIANNFTDITDYTKLHLVKRADGSSPWVLDGTHVASSGSNALATLQRTGMSGFSQFGVGGKSDESLPVTLLNFSGYKDGSRNQLRWTTATEINNRGFDVQRSADGINYSSIGFVNSTANGGNSNDRLSYGFTDNNPAGIKHYYRLRQEDLDGRSKLSNVVLIRSERANDVMIDGLFPNPANDVVNVLVSVPGRTKLTMLVTDMAGRTLSQKVVSAETGSNTIQLDVSSIARGTYLVRVVCEDGCEPVPAKFVKQ
jgi:hypothetical protein